MVARPVQVSRPWANSLTLALVLFCLKALVQRSKTASNMDFKLVSSSVFF